MRANEERETVTNTFTQEDQIAVTQAAEHQFIKKKNMPLTDRRIHREMRKTNSHDVCVNMSVSIYMAV